MLIQVTVSMVWVGERTYIIEIVAFFLRKINPSFAGAILGGHFLYNGIVLYFNSLTLQVFTELWEK
jgi:hypothetical protein